MLYNFGVKYWHIVDANDDGALDFDEFRFTMAGFAATNAGVILAAFDENDDGILVEDELEELGEWLEAILENTVNDSHVYFDALKEAWRDAQG